MDGMKAGLDELWARYKKRTQRLLSANWWRELSLMSRFELTPVRLESVMNEVPRGTVPDCAACMDNCCGGLDNLVSLRLVDVATLIDLERADLMTTTKPRFPDELLEKKPSLRTLQQSWLFRTLPVLRQIGPEHRCAALTTNLRCSLYPNWPASCERFPYLMTPDRKKVRWGTRCPSRSRVPNPSRAEALSQGAVAVFNERIKDAVLLHHARSELDDLGFGPFLA